MPQCGTYPEGTFDDDPTYVFRFPQELDVPIDRLTRAIDWGLLLTCVLVGAMCVVAMLTLLGWT